jgi:hypothetical protein
MLLLVAPIDAAFRFQGIEAFKGQITIRWLFGLVRYHVRTSDIAKKKLPELRTGPKSAKARLKGVERDDRANVLAVLRQAAFRQHVYRLLKNFVHAIQLKELGLQVRLGLGDPADTGRLWAFVGPLNAVAQNLNNTVVRIEPEFMEPVCEIEAHGRFLLIPLRFVALAVAFALSPTTIRAWRTLRASHA